MKNHTTSMSGWIIGMIIASLGCVPAARAELQVVATLPDLAAVAREIGGQHVEITTLAKPTEDPHFVDARPSFIIKLKGAQALIEGGAQLEIGWLPPLLQGSRNPSIQSPPGLIVAAQGIKMLEVPESLSRAQGDIHSMGNPHFMVDPVRAVLVARHIADAFVALDPAHSSDYQENFNHFKATVGSRLEVWLNDLAPFKGQSVAAYHDSWVYFGDRFGLNVDVFLEPKPGIPPSPSHLAKVIDEIKRHQIKAILVEPYHDRRVAESLASKTGATVVDFAQYPGALPETETYIKLMDSLVTRLSRAMKGAPQEGR